MGFTCVCLLSQTYNAEIAQIEGDIRCIRRSCPMLACSLLFSANTESHKREPSERSGEIAVDVLGVKPLQLLAEERTASSLPSRIRHAEGDEGGTTQGRDSQTGELSYSAVIVCHDSRIIAAMEKIS